MVILPKSPTTLLPNTFYIMELAIAIIVIIAIVVLPYGLIAKGHDENTKLTEENSRLKSRLDALLTQPAEQEKPVIPEMTPEEPLTIEKIALAIQDRHYGYVQEVTEDAICFTVKDLNYKLYTDRLPQFFLVLQFGVEPEKYNLELLKHAAHLMSDDIIMVKAQMNEEPWSDGRIGLMFLVVAMDRNYSSFKENLDYYIDIINDGRQNLREHYERLEKERKEALPLLTSYASSDAKENKIIS